jgi:hypothetical protein
MPVYNSLFIAFGELATLNSLRSVRRERSVVFGLMTHLEFLTLFGSFTNEGQESGFNRPEGAKRS